jgi:hypothetical protein
MEYQDYRVRQRSTVCSTFLGAVARVTWNPCDKKLSVPSSDRWSDRKGKSDLENMLRACVLHYGKNWDKCLSLAEFSYNNSYQSSLKWSQAGEREIFGPDLVLEAEEKSESLRRTWKLLKLDRRAIRIRGESL